MKNISKIVFAVLALVAIVGFTSCNKDKKNEKKLVGSWKAVSTHTKEYENGVLTNEETEDVTDDNTIWKFEKDGKFTAVDGTESSTGTYSVSGDQLTVNTTAGSFPASFTGKYELNGNTLKYNIGMSYTSDNVNYKDDIEVTFNKQ